MSNWIHMTPRLEPSMTPKLPYCPVCATKDKTIETLQRICRGYEIRIKRFQTLSKNRRKVKKK